MPVGDPPVWHWSETSSCGYSIVENAATGGGLHCGSLGASRLHVARRAVVSQPSCEHMLIPLHTITFGQSLVFIIKAHTLVMLALTYNVLYHHITMRIGN